MSLFNLNWLTLHWVWVMFCIVIFLLDLPISKSPPCNPPAVKVPPDGCAHKLGYNNINKHTYYLVTLKAKSMPEAENSCAKAHTELVNTKKLNYTNFHLVKKESFECGRDVLEGLEEYTGGIQTDAIWTGAEELPGYTDPCKLVNGNWELTKLVVQPMPPCSKSVGYLFKEGTEPFECAANRKECDCNVLCEGYE